MGYHIKIPPEHCCMVEDCKVTKSSRKELQKHYKEDHNLKEQLKASIVIRGYEYRIGDQK